MFPEAPLPATGVTAVPTTLNLVQESFQASLRLGHSRQICGGMLLTLNSLTACAVVQQSMAEGIETARAALRPWARRAEKQAARARSSSPGRTTSRRTPTADQGTLARQISTGSAGGSGERSIQSYLARSSRDGDVPDLISQVRQGCCDYKRTIKFLAATHESFALQLWISSWSVPHADEACLLRTCNSVADRRSSKSASQQLCLPDSDRGVCNPATLQHPM